MIKKPRKAGANLFSNGVGKNIVIMGLIQGVIMLLCYVYGIYALGGEIYALTMAFYALNIIQFFYFISMRTSGRTAENSIFQNKWAVASVVSCFGLMLLIACTPLHSVLGLATLPFGGWAVIGLGCVLTFIASEIVKFCLADKQ
ncbi:MAG: cation transporting ATPase C-terminal domain-containing protein [Clostridia bacterium]|nr:cation transporting ATPase C-terminal domain-containing protein [Clostridia bacterium]